MILDESHLTNNQLIKAGTLMNQTDIQLRTVELYGQVFSLSGAMIFVKIIHCSSFVKKCRFLTFINNINLIFRKGFLVIFYYKLIYIYISFFFFFFRYEVRSR